MMAIVLTRFRGQMERLKVPGHGFRLVFSDLVEVIHRKTTEYLSLARTGPEDLNASNRLGLSQADFLPQRRRAKAAPGTDRFVITVFASSAVYDDPDAGTDSTAIGLNSFEF